ncbi:unnamed protein product [Lactuca virosa]|uniref:Uncharacterized protein n=1 Tax=Lactuca virosa TaxID=75947 RepID=A0AAU9PV65_9ASTR|nr:unnamed protein product [Lactuca virosa]
MDVSCFILNNCNPIVVGQKISKLRACGNFDVILWRETRSPNRVGSKYVSSCLSTWCTNPDQIKAKLKLNLDTD